MFVFAYRQLRLAGEDRGPEDKEEQARLYEAIRVIQRNTDSRKADNHQVITGLVGIDGVSQSDFVLMTDGYAHVATKVRAGDGSMFLHEAKTAERTFLYSDKSLPVMKAMHHSTLAAAYAAYLVGETGWMGDDFLVALEKLDRDVRFVPR